MRFHGRRIKIPGGMKTYLTHPPSELTSDATNSLGSIRNATLANGRTHCCRIPVKEHLELESTNRTAHYTGTHTWSLTTT
jgi:hypothetical protein